MRLKLFAGTLRCATLAVAAAILCPAALPAAELSQGEKDTIYIGELQVQPAVISSASVQGRGEELRAVVQSLDAHFTTALSATRVFQLVERKRKADIELEQGFAAVAVDPDDKNMAQAGKMAGARFAFLPQIDAFEDNVETMEYQTVGRAAMNRNLYLSAVVNVVDTTTGKLLPDTPSVQLRKVETLEGVRIGQAKGSVQTLVELAKEMAQKLSRELVGLLRPAKVLSLTGKQILINRGSDAGFNSGDLVEVYATQDVKDDDTGEIFRNEVPVGQAKIVRLDKKQSFAMIFGEDVGIVKGCIVRPLKQDAAAAEKGAAAEAAGPGDSPGSSEKPLNWK